VIAAVACLLGVLMDTVNNPIIWADVPDPSIVRVGDSYYMSSTTMHMSPGLPIMKSNDLVHWKLVSYAYRTLGDTDELDLQNGKNAYGRGSWASSLRFHQGRFYVSTFSSTTGKTYIYSTDKPEKTPWTEVASFSPAFHDSSLFFDDDGRVYLVFGAGDIRLVELQPDLSGPKPGGVNKVIVENASRIAGEPVGLPAEGSQIFKLEGRYYLWNIAWPRGGMRTEIVHRSDRIDGPYEGRIVFQDKGIAQGGMIDTPSGQWYAYLFQDHGAVGRIPYILPTTWENGWPLIGDAGKLPASPDAAQPSGTTAGLVESDDFNHPRLSLVWQWNHNPDDRFWSLSDRKGWLRLTTGRVDLVVTQARNTLTQRTFGPECSATTLMDLSGMKDGDYAGLIALQNHYGFVGVKAQGDRKSVVVVTHEGGAPTELASIPLDQNGVFLRLGFDFRNRADLAHFFYSVDNKIWKEIGTPLHLRYDLVHFMGCRMGLFNFATKSPGGHADFDFFRVGANSSLTSG
jgi:beta-xylosidase